VVAKRPVVNPPVDFANKKRRSGGGGNRRVCDGLPRALGRAYEQREVPIMSETKEAADAGRSWVPLAPRQRRVLGVLVEKAKTTPEYYPMSLAAIVTACNQKSNRDPLTNYEQDEVEETLQTLRKKGAAVLVEGSGRVPRWKHTLYDWLKVSKVELAVMAELFLRGPQTEGELRARASRMEPLPDLPALQGILQALADRGLVHYLSPPGQKRGVSVAHALYPADEFEKVRQTFGSRHSGDEEATSRPMQARVDAAAVHDVPEWAAEIRGVHNEVLEIRAEILELRALVAEVSAEVRELKSAIGA
jgi:uncharacterized protein YceH (UPF0502 family)